MWVVYALLALVGYFFVGFLLRYVASNNPMVVSLILYGSASILTFLYLIPGKVIPESRLFGCNLLCERGYNNPAFFSIFQS